MASYDSDSDGYEDTEYTETDVLLGYASRESKGETISRLGGRPAWLDPKSPPSASLAKCKACKEHMVLLLQLNGELPERFPTHERRLYVFSCRRKACRRKEGSIRAIRGVRLAVDAQPSASSTEEKRADESSKQTQPQAPAISTGLGESLFGVKSLAGVASSANPFSTPSSSLNPFSKPQGTQTASAEPTPAPTNPFGKNPASENPKAVEASISTLPRTFAETLNINNPTSSAPTAGPPPPPEPWPEESALPPAYPVSWISDAEYETLEPTSLPKVPQATVMDIDGGEGASSGGGKEDKEVFESTMDSTFQKFADRVGQNPEQCIRYEYSGAPLLYAKGDEVARILGEGHDGGSKVRAAKGMPRCGNCGAGRVFEVQLVPHAIEELESEEDGLDGMDWGTIIIGVCERDCVERGQKAGEAGYLEEWAGVQWEELTMKR